MTSRYFLAVLTITCCHWGASAAFAQKGASPPVRFAFVGTFSSPLRDVLPTQVDLPPGNGQGIHCFKLNPETGELVDNGIERLGTSPSSLVLNKTFDRLYSANETDRVGDPATGTVSSFKVDSTSGRLSLLNTVSSGGAGPTYVSLHPSGKYLFVANYFGGSIAVIPVLADGRLAEPTECGKIKEPSDPHGLQMHLLGVLPLVGMTVRTRI